MEAIPFETLDTSVRRHVMEALTLARGNQRRAAELLGVTRWKLARMVARFELRDAVTNLRSADDATEISVAEQAPSASTSVHHAR